MFDLKDFDKKIIQIQTIMNQSLDSFEIDADEMSKEKFLMLLNFNESVIRLNQTYEIYLTASKSLGDLNLVNNQMKKLNQKVKFKRFLYFCKIKFYFIL